MVHADSDELPPVDILRQAQELEAAAARRSEALDSQVHINSSGSYNLQAPLVQAPLPTCGDSQATATGMLAAADIRTACTSGIHASTEAFWAHNELVLLAQMVWCSSVDPAVSWSHMVDNCATMQMIF